VAGRDRLAQVLKVICDARVVKQRAKTLTWADLWSLAMILALIAIVVRRW
jgi:hypothetical protein